jgi:hypothetical protein
VIHIRDISGDIAVGFFVEWNLKRKSTWNVNSINCLPSDELSRIVGITGVLKKIKTVNKILGVAPDIDEVSDDYEIYFPSDRGVKVYGIVRNHEVTSLAFEKVE